MPKYLFRGLDAASAPGPGPTIWFQSPTIFNDLAAQVSRSGIDTYNVAAEITLNGVDFRAVTFTGGAGIGNLPNGNYVHLGSVGLSMGFRLNLLSLTPDGSPSLTVILAIDQKD